MDKGNRRRSGSSKCQRRRHCDRPSARRIGGSAALPLALRDGKTRGEVWTRDYVLRRRTRYSDGNRDQPKLGEWRMSKANLVPAPPKTTWVLDQDHPLVFSDVIAQNAKYFGNKTCVICGSQRLTWAEFDARTNEVANALLGIGLRKGDSVCLHMTTSIAMFELLWGTIKAGGVIAPLNVMMARDSLRLMVNNAGAAVVFVDATTIEAMDAVRDQITAVPKNRFFAFGYTGDGWQGAETLLDGAVASDPGVAIELTDSMSIIYSSGTTGIPKGIEHTHYGRLMYPLGFGPALRIDRNTTTVCTTPLYTNGTW